MNTSERTPSIGSCAVCGLVIADGVSFCHHADRNLCVPCNTKQDQILGTHDAIAHARSCVLRVLENDSSAAAAMVSHELLQCLIHWEQTYNLSQLDYYPRGYRDRHPNTGR